MNMERDTFLVFLTALIELLVCVHSQKGSPRAIRLVGPVAYIGQVQIFHNSNWYSICQDDWNQQGNLKNAKVVCRQLGYKTAISAPPLGYATLDGDQGDTIEGFDCAGDESRLDLCPLLPGNWTSHKCRQMAGVMCKTPKANEYPVRLVGGTSSNEGRVEIKHGGEWTTVCDTGWDKRDADIICHQLGYGRALKATPGGYYEQGTGEILLGNVRCKRDDLRFRFDIRYCNVTDWYPSQDECTHVNDAGVECDARDPELEVRLSGPNMDTVQIRYNEDWMSICEENWNMDDADVVCRQLGFSRAQTAPKTGYHGWQGYYLRNFLCKGNETRLDQCKRRGDWTLQKCAGDQFAGVRCVGGEYKQTKTTRVTHYIGGGTSTRTHSTAAENAIVVAVVCGILLFIFSLYFIGYKARQRRKRKERTLQLDETETGTISLEENELGEIRDDGLVLDDNSHFISMKDDEPLVKEDDE